MKSILFLSSNSIREPYLHTQGIPHIQYLRDKANFFLLTVEANKTYLKSFYEDIEEKGINWVPIILGVKDYYSIPWVFRIVLEIVFSCLKLYTFVRKRNVDLIHCRGYIMSVVGLIFKKAFSVPYIFDMRGLLPDELACSGKWKKGSVLFCLAKKLEKTLIVNSQNTIVTSNAFHNYVANYYRNRADIISKLVTIYNSVDVERYYIDNEPRELLFTYIGAGHRGQYVNLMIDIYANVTKRLTEKHRFSLYIQNQQTRNELKSYIQEKYPHLLDKIEISVCDHKQIPDILAKATFGFSLDRLDITRKIASPIKFAEYLASGTIPIVNIGIGDLAEDLKVLNLNTVIDVNKVDYKQISTDITELSVSKELGAIKEKIRIFAKEKYSTEISAQRLIDNCYLL